MADMSKSNKNHRTCDGTCKKFQVKKLTGKSRYGSGQGHCQICDTWIDHNVCHMKDGANAQEGSVGWFCNCCNYRVRQKPRNKKYKEKLRNESIEYKEEVKKDGNVEEVKSKNLDISKGQAVLLKRIVVGFQNKKHDGNISDGFNRISKSDQFEIKDNWGSLEKFYELARNYKKLNQISAIFLFEELNEKIGQVASKIHFLKTANIDESWINNEFKSWGNFLELLGHDPWYRDNTKSVKKIESAKEIEVELEEYEKIKWKNKESVNEIFENLNELKIDLMKDYKIKDSENKFAGYSHVDMLNLLEKYLKTLPKNTRYSDIKNFF